MREPAPGDLYVNIATVTPTKVVVLEKVKTLCDDYKLKPFNLDRRAKCVSIYGAEAVAIVRRFSERYPEFLENKFFAFQWADAQRLPNAEVSDTGVVFTQNKQGLVSGQAVAEFIQIMFQTFDMDDFALVCPIHSIRINKGYCNVPEVYAVQRKRIATRGVFEWVKSQKATLDKRIDKDTFNA